MQSFPSFNQTGSDGSNNAATTSCTGFVSDEKLVEQAANINELILMSSMLLSMVSFETTNNNNSENNNSEANLKS